jgi:hypothetical protein
MKLPRKQAAVVQDAITRWRDDGLIPDAQAATLAATIEVQYFDWRKLAKYSFWIALFSIISSVSAALSDRMLQDLLEVIFKAPALLRCAVLAVPVYFIMDHVHIRQLRRYACVGAGETDRTLPLVDPIRGGGRLGDLLRPAARQRYHQRLRRHVPGHQPPVSSASPS